MPLDERCICCGDYHHSLLLLGFDKQSIVGSVVSAVCLLQTLAARNPCGSLYNSLTHEIGLDRYYLRSVRPAGEDASDCGVPPNFIFAQGLSTMHYVYTVKGDSGSPTTIEAGCQITVDHGYCSSALANAGRSEINLSGTAFPYSDFEGLSVGAQVVTIVGDAVNPGSTASSTAATATAPTKATTGNTISRIWHCDERAQR